MSDNLYFSSNPDREHLQKIKFGYVKGNDKNLINRLSDNTEQFSDHSYFTGIYTFSKTDKYKLPYKEVDKIISLIARYPDKIKILEDIYDIKLPYMRQLSPFLVVGTNINNEFINTEGISILIKVLKIEYPKLGLKLDKIYSKDEIETINSSSKKRIEDKNKENYDSLMKLHKLRRTNKQNIEINLWTFQEETLAKIINYFQNNDKCILNWVCRLGKTILSIKLLLTLKQKSVVIGVPSISLLNQWYENIEKYCGGEYQIIKIGDNSKDIVHSYDTPTIYLTTYRSSYKLKSIQCDLKILDEMHHLTYSISNDTTTDASGSVNITRINTDKKNRAILEIDSKYQLGLTATLKTSENEKIIGNNEQSIFGKNIDEKTLSWAIVNGYVCDYEIASPITNIDDIKDRFDELKIETNIDLFVSCLSILELFKTGTHNHILNITNRCENSKLCRDIMNMLLEFPEYGDIKGHIQNDIVISDTNSRDEKTILDNFRQSPFGIIHCCYKLTEGFDEKRIDSVCLSESMYSETRIFQSLLRPHTKDINRLDKKALILIPIGISDDWEQHEKDCKFKKVFTVLESMSMSDENVNQKLKFIPSYKESNKQDDVEDIENQLKIYDESLKLKFINKHMIKGCSFSKLKKIINLLGGRRYEELTLEEDYIEKIRNTNNRLPSLDVIKRILMNKNKTWLDLYSISIDDYLSYEEFKTKFSNLYDRDEYIKFQKRDTNLPLYSDLENIYASSGYNIDFWNNPIGNDDEF